jgi:peptidoglycan/xylan/chitin deacetylase (PgdA/CDA1 family)
MGGVGVKRLAPLLAALLIAAGCGRASPEQVPSRTVPVVSDPTRVIVGPAPPEPELPPPQMPGQPPAEAPLQPVPQPLPEPAEPVPPAEPPIRWYPRGIGHPLVSDDERASGRKVALLTFDDGPHPEITPLILDILNERKVSALFFVTGYGARHRDLIERIHREGHQIGTHTQHHQLLTGLTRAEIIDAIDPVNKLVEAITGQRPRYFRPPHGMYNQTVLDVLKELNMELINWSNGSLDWSGVDARGWKDPSLVVRDVMRQLHPGAVILFHDTHRHTAEALPEVIRELESAGYQFVLLPEQL